jgi:hypothetical protein
MFIPPYFLSFPAILNCPYPNYSPTLAYLKHRTPIFFQLPVYYLMLFFFWFLSRPLSFYSNSIPPSKLDQNHHTFQESFLHCPMALMVSYCHQLACCYRLYVRQEFDKIMKNEKKKKKKRGNSCLVGSYRSRQCVQGKHK